VCTTYKIYKQNLGTNFLSISIKYVKKNVLGFKNHKILAHKTIMVFIGVRTGVAFAIFIGPKDWLMVCGF